MRRTDKHKTGMILFVVTIVIAMLAVGALALLSLLTTEYEATRLRGDEIQAGQLVQSGIEYVSTLIATPETERAPTESEFADSFDLSGQEKGPHVDSGGFYDNPDRFRGIEVVPNDFGRIGRGSGRFTVFSPKIESNKLIGVRFGLVNESSRLHLGSVLDWENENPGQGSRSLLKLPGMTPSMADSILDWVDADKTARASGAELEYYERTGVPYRPRNAVPATLEELLLVRDVTRPLLFGNDKSFSYGAKMSDLQRIQVEAEVQADAYFQGQAEISSSTTEPPPPSVFDDMMTSSPAENALPWCFLLTTLSAEKLVNPDGKPRIYLNDGNQEFLETQLKEHLDEESVQFVMAWRKNRGNVDDPVDLLDAEVEVKETHEKLKSPFSLEQSASEEKFLKLLDYTTTSPEIVISGRINVNEAPRTVLEAVPGLDSAKVSQIISRRGNIGEKRQGRFRHPVWLLGEKVVDKEAMKKLSKKLTTGGDVYRAQVVGFFDHRGTASRAEIVVDATVKPPRQIFSKDLTMFGSGFE